jgi:hypothetical protein
MYAFNANTGVQLWVYGTEMPLGHTPTFFAPNNTVYVGGFDHKIHAVNASNGEAKAGWTFTDAGAGFDTNPLVISDSYTGDQPIVFAGNRDGYFYAFDGNTGVLKWRYQTEGPIKFSAAYKQGVVYFASDDAYAYALQLTSNGNSNTLKWKKGKFPGVGFDMYWPVVYTDPVTSTDYVIFSSSIKAGGYWFEGNIDMYRNSTVAMFQGYTGLCGTVSTSNNSDPTNPRNYLWKSGTRVIKCDAIFNYLNAVSTKYHRFVFILSRDTGDEYTPYAPFNVAGHDGGGQGYKQPPIVAGDGVIYQRIGFSKGGNGGATGNIVGWKFGTEYISDINNDYWASDEPAVFTSGGDGNNTLVYYGEGSFNHEGFGTIDPAGTYGSNVINWSGNLGKPGAGVKYTSWSLSGKFKAGNSISNSSYGYMDGLLNFSPIPYKNKIFLINGNTLFALSSAGTANSALAMVNAPTQRQSANIITTKSDIRTKLAQEIQKMLDAGHLRPGFHDSCQVSQSMTLGYPGYFIPGNHLMTYFDNPADTVTTLTRALALPDSDLSLSLKTQVRTYLQNNYGPSASYSISQYAHIGWSGGASREWFEDTPDIIRVFNTNVNYYTPTNKQSTICCQATERAPLSIGSYPPESVYAAWQYALRMNLTQQQAGSLLSSMASRLPSRTTMSDNNLIKYPYILNQYLAGYRGYVELDKLANNLTSITQSTKYNDYVHLVDLRLNNFSKDLGYPDDYDAINALNVSGNFMYITPELGTELRNNKLAQAQTTLNEYYLLTPYWFVSKYNTSYGETYSMPLYDYHGLYQAKAKVLNEPFSELVKYIDIPAFWRGDLFYIQNLVAALEAPGDITPPPPSPTGPIPLTGDLDNDNDVDLLDLLKLLGVFGSISPAFGDLNHNGRIDIFDVNTLMQNL